MATKSFLKDVEIRGESMGDEFAKALETSEYTSGKKVEMSRQCSEIKGETVKVFLSGLTKC